MLSDKSAAHDLLALAKAHSLNQVVFSPGSRNAPLITSFNSDSFFNCISIPDERSAGFFALGISLQNKKPSVLSCTSGSALLNYSPAIVEAYYQKIPLLIITADRPKEWTDQGDSQTIRQGEIYKNYIVKSYELVQESSHKNDLWYNQRIINEAIAKATGPIPGPVHINIPFREPLYNKADQISEESRVIKESTPVPALSDSEIAQLASEWNNAEKKLIICGQLPPGNKLMDPLNEIVEDESVTILSESTSNLSGSKLIPSIDRVITTFHSSEIDTIKPDLVLYVGEAIVSKKIKAMIREQGGSEQWRIGMDYQFVDVFKSMTRNIRMEAGLFFSQLKNHIKSRKSTYQQLWSDRNEATLKKHRSFLQSCPWSDLKAFELILNKIPSGSHIHQGNSSPVRYVQLFNYDRSSSYYGNRGVSGIDGCTSTAAGSAYANDEVHTLITGDLSFLYDSNALWNKYIRGNLRIIVINNGGGGIFRIIPGPDTTEVLDEFFECEHPGSIQKIADAFDCPYMKAHDETELQKGLDWIYSDDAARRPKVLEIFTPKHQNDKILKEYFEYIKD